MPVTIDNDIQVKRIKASSVTIGGTAYTCVRHPLAASVSVSDVAIHRTSADKIIHLAGLIRDSELLTVEVDAKDPSGADLAATVGTYVDYVAKLDVVTGSSDAASETTVTVPCYVKSAKPASEITGEDTGRTATYTLELQPTNITAAS